MNNALKLRTQYPIPSKLQNLVIPDELKKTFLGEDFLLSDSGPSCSRVLIFGTESTILLLSEASTLFGDETFKVFPSLFYQLYTIHALHSVV